MIDCYIIGFIWRNTFRDKLLKLVFYLEIIHHCFSDPELMVYCCDFSDTAVDLVKVRHHFNSAYWVIFHAFLSSADFFFQNQLF